MTSTSPQTGSNNHNTTSQPEQQQNQNQPLFHGHCFCSLTTYTLTSLPIRAYICHCRDCRFFSGTSFAHNAVFPASSLTIISSEHQPSSTGGSSALTTYGQQGQGTRRFCSACGSPLFMTVPDRIESMRGQVIVAVGTIEGSEEDGRLRPVAEGWCRRREGWLRGVDGAEGFREW